MKILVIYKKSTHSVYHESPDENTLAYMRSESEHVNRMQQSHSTHERSLATVLEALDKNSIDYETLYRADFKGDVECDLIITIGGDGTLLEAAHHVTDIPIMGVNSVPDRSVGFFTHCTAADFEKELKRLDDISWHSLNRFEMVLDGKPIKEFALNDVLIAHSDPSQMTRYRLLKNSNKSWRGNGILVSTAAGSGARMYSEGGELMPLDSKKLQYLLRGVRNQIPQFASELFIKSESREGQLHIDGGHLKYPFSLGSEVLIRPGKPVTIIADLSKKRLFRTN